tara:strand:+ start:311 stop:850 length:540 start_codon:yes stop_codon:yes gene_type:complete
MSHITFLIHGIIVRIFKEIVNFILSFTVIMILFIKAESQAACRGEGYMGISSRDPIMSWVDLTYSPVYSSASTSGTSGCKNWDFGYERYTEYVLRQFIKKSHEKLLSETVQGKGPHIEALSRLMACPSSSKDAFSDMLKEYRQQTVEIFSTSRQSNEFLVELKLWIDKNPELRETCGLS